MYWNHTKLKRLMYEKYEFVFVCWWDEARHFTKNSFVSYSLFFIIKYHFLSPLYFLSSHSSKSFSIHARIYRIIECHQDSIHRDSNVDLFSYLFARLSLSVTKLVRLPRVWISGTLIIISNLRNKTFNELVSDLLSYGESWAKWAH